MTDTSQQNSYTAQGTTSSGASSKPATPASLDMIEKPSAEKTPTTPIESPVKLFPYEMALSLYKGLLGEARHKLANGEISV